MGVKFSFMVGLGFWFLDFPNRVHNFGYFLSIHFMFDSFEVSVMWSTLLPVFLLAVRVIPIFRSTSLPQPMMLFVFFSMRRIWQSGAFHNP